MIYLYIKTHNITGLKYFGKVRDKDPNKYPGSGVYWKKHLAKHGPDVSTEVVKKFEKTDKDLELWALEFSKNNNIVQSSKWANLKPENGLDGGTFSEWITNKTRRKMSEAAKKRSMGENNNFYGKKHSDDTRKKMRKPKSKLPPKKKCPYCDRTFRPNVYIPHIESCCYNPINLRLCPTCGSVIKRKGQKHCSKKCSLIPRVDILK